MFEKSKDWVAETIALRIENRSLRFQRNAMFAAYLVALFFVVVYA